MGLSRAISEINGDFRRKSQNFAIPVYLAPRQRDSPWNLVSALGVYKTRMTGLPGRERSLTISSTLWIQYTKPRDPMTYDCKVMVH